MGITNILEHEMLVKRKLGEGSGRAVYGVKNRPLAIKRAKSHAGVAQNREEYRLYHSLRSKGDARLNLLAEVYEISSCGEQLLVERCCKLEEYLKTRYIHGKRIDADQLSSINFPTLRELENLEMEYGLYLQDTLMHNSWGISKVDGRLKLVNYGYTVNSHKEIMQLRKQGII